MKKIKLFFAVVCVVACCLQSCNNGKTYAEMKEEEADAINAWILSHDYQVISERDFYNQDTITNENQFVLFEESGVYMNIVQPGEGTSKLADGYYEMASRYFEIAMQNRDGMFAVGDTLSGNMNLLDYPAYRVNSSWSLSQYMLYPEVYKLTIRGSSYSAAFTESYQMYSIYGTTSVPSGWLIPLKYIKPSRTTSSEKVARVRLIVPHGQGTSQASQYVYPCYYEITYNLGK